MNIIQILNPRYLENGAIDCEVLFEGGALPVPYTAMATDSAETGRQIWEELQGGKWGEVAPFTVTPEHLEVARAAKHAEIITWRDMQEKGNVIFELDDHRWDAGKASQERLAPVVSVARAGALPEGFFWTDADNHDIPVDAAFLARLEAGMTQAMVLQGFRIHERQRQMKEEIAAMTDMKAIRAYTVGWGADE
ncbi:TPA: DUF4376 domain-containing protein [Escherichia coli]